MIDLLELTNDDIRLLNDSDLRTLIGRLCEADYRIAGLPTNGILWGGHQDASDGGLDVIIRSESDPPRGSFVPRKTTGFQVKKPDMSRSMILKEMQPNGFLRSEIKELISQKGAYIVVSSGASNTAKALENRVKAMREAVANEIDNEQLIVNFIDCGTIANWVRNHPSLILWVRNKIGKPLQGWQSYGNWASSPKGMQDQYLLDDDVRLFDGMGYGEGISVLEGIKRLRLYLSGGTTSIRLIGLSGVGKTRLIQTLFDEKIGEFSINPDIAYYTDISSNPVPDPIFFATQLKLTNKKAVLLIDNCSPELHRQLTSLCANSEISLLTVEYDVQDDLPEETMVFRLEPASNGLIEKLIKHRYAYISDIDASKIAEFSSGNARVAIALANTLKLGESLSTLRDQVLFDRLFYQNHRYEGLVISAEACSLVYSFNGEDTSDQSELDLIAKLAGKSIKDIYRDIQELKKRGLIQSRGVWKAMLPHAIANRLAKQALESIPQEYIVNTFLYGKSERLLRSFAHRLSFLHDSSIAKDIANNWLKKDEWLGKANCDFNSLGISIFTNIAPIVPESTLSALENAAIINSSSEFFIGNNQSRHEFIKLLQHLAYEPNLFERSVRLLCQFALMEDPNTNNGSSARSVLETLFHIYLSGTNAPLEMRIDIINDFIMSDNQEEANLGVNLLRAAMKTDYFHTGNLENFGARSRDYGYWPKCAREICDWYDRVVDVCRNVAKLEKAISKQVKDLYAENLQSLWAIGTNCEFSLLEKLETTAIQIHQSQGWNAGWIAVREILHHDDNLMPQESRDRLIRLEKVLRPKSLIERARTYALTTEWLTFDSEDDYHISEDLSYRMKRIAEITSRIGTDVAQDITTLKILLPELVVASNDRIWSFGAGLANNCENRQEIWQMLYDQFADAPIEHRRFGLLQGFLSSCAELDPIFYATTLDSLIEDKVLGEWFPNFQLTSTIDFYAIERLNKSLDSTKVKVRIDSFRNLAYGRQHESIDDDSLAMLVEKINSKEHGVFTAIEILAMRFHKEKNKQVICSSKLEQASQAILLSFPYEVVHSVNDLSDFKLAKIAEVCLIGNDNVETARKIFIKIADSFERSHLLSFNYPYLFSCLARLHPYIFLDVFLGFEGETGFNRIGFDDLGNKDYPTNQIPEHILISWCEKDPEVRYPKLILSFQPYIVGGDKILSWKPIIYSILEKAPTVQEVLTQLQLTLLPKSWSGSHADALEKRLGLLSSLYDHPNPKVQYWAKEQHLQLLNEIKKQRANELGNNKERYERFE